MTRLRKRLSKSPLSPPLNSIRKQFQIKLTPQPKGKDSKTMEYLNNYQAAFEVRENEPKLLSRYTPCIFCGHSYPFFKGIKVGGGYSLNADNADTPLDTHQIFICDRCIIAKALHTLSYLIKDDLIGKGFIAAALKIQDHQKAVRDDTD